MTLQLPEDFYCPWCKAEYHECAEVDWRGQCIQRTAEDDGDIQLEAA